MRISKAGNHFVTGEVRFSGFHSYECSFYMNLGKLNILVVKPLHCVCVCFKILYYAQNGFIPIKNLFDHSKMWTNLSTYTDWKKLRDFKVLGILVSLSSVMKSKYVR